MEELKKWSMFINHCSAYLLLLVQQLALGAVIGFSDAMIFAMMVPNMVGLVLLAPKVRDELSKYMML